MTLHENSKKAKELFENILLRNNIAYKIIDKYSPEYNDRIYDFEYAFEVFWGKVNSPLLAVDKIHFIVQTQDLPIEEGMVIHPAKFILPKGRNLSFIVSYDTKSWNFIAKTFPLVNSYVKKATEKIERKYPTGPKFAKKYKIVIGTKPKNVHEKYMTNKYLNEFLVDGYNLHDDNYVMAITQDKITEFLSNRNKYPGNFMLNYLLLSKKRNELKSRFRDSHIFV